MLTRTKFAIAALLLIGSASGAFAQAPYGDNRPVSLRTYRAAAGGAYGYGPGWRSYAYAPGPVARRPIARRAWGPVARRPIARRAWGPVARRPFAPRAWGAYAYAPGGMMAPGAWGAYAYAPGPMMAPGAWGAYAAAPAAAPSHYDWMKVYEAGKLIGQDPDPNVRMMLSKDFTYQ